MLTGLLNEILIFISLLLFLFPHISSHQKNLVRRFLRRKLFHRFLCRLFHRHFCRHFHWNHFPPNCELRQVLVARQPLLIRRFGRIYFRQFHFRRRLFDQPWVNISLVILFIKSYIVMNLKKSCKTV